MKLNVFTFNNVYISIKIYSSIHLVIFVVFYDNITMDWS